MGPLGVYFSYFLKNISDNVKSVDLCLFCFCTDGHNKSSAKIEILKKTRQSFLNDLLLIFCLCICPTEPFFLCCCDDKFCRNHYYHHLRKYHQPRNHSTTDNYIIIIIIVTITRQKSVCHCYAVFCVSSLYRSSSAVAAHLLTELCSSIQRTQTI